MTNPLPLNQYIYAAYDPSIWFFNYGYYPRFPWQPVTVKSLNVTGPGVVTSVTNVLNCTDPMFGIVPVVCSVSIAPNAPLKLLATYTGSSKPSIHWGTACTGALCTVTTNEDVNVNVQFGDDKISSINQ